MSQTVENMRVNGDNGPGMGQESQDTTSRNCAVTVLHRIEGLNRTSNFLSVLKVELLFPVSA